MWQQQDGIMEISTIASVQTTVYGTIQNTLQENKSVLLKL